MKKILNNIGGGVHAFEKQFHIFEKGVHIY